MFGLPRRSLRFAIVTRKPETSSGEHPAQPALGVSCREPVFFFVCCSVSFVVGSLKDEPGRRVSE